MKLFFTDNGTTSERFHLLYIFSENVWTTSGVQLISSNFNGMVVCKVDHLSLFSLLPVRLILKFTEIMY